MGRVEVTIISIFSMAIFIGMTIFFISTSSRVTAKLDATNKCEAALAAANELIKALKGK